LGGCAVLSAALAAVLSGSILSVAVPRPVTTAPPGPVLESVTPAQLTAMNLRLEATVQPVRLPAWLTTLGYRPPSTIVLRPDAEAVVHRSSGGVRSVVEVTLAYATLSRPGGLSVRGPTIVHRLVWVVVGLRAVATTAGSTLQILWLIDAHRGRQLTELTVPAPVPAAAAPSTGR
jgi:hypothetical protein